MDRLREALSRTDATPAQVDAAVAINTDARLNALRLGLLFLAAISALAVLPASRLPSYRPHEIPNQTTRRPAHRTSKATSPTRPAPRPAAGVRGAIFTRVGLRDNEG